MESYTFNNRVILSTPTITFDDHEKCMQIIHINMKTQDFAN